MLNAKVEQVRVVYRITVHRLNLQRLPDSWSRVSPAEGLGPYRGGGRSVSVSVGAGSRGTLLPGRGLPVPPGEPHSPE